MKSRLMMLALVTAFAALVSTPAHLHGQQAIQGQDHEQHHPAGAAEPTPKATPAPPATPQASMMDMMARMKATDPKLDALVKKMNAATGAAKTDAIAELLTAMVEDRRNHFEPMMANMMSMMNMMPGRGGRAGVTPATPAK